MNKIYDFLYHKDENDNLRIWFMEQEGFKYRTTSGISGGVLVESEWKEITGKNKGKANATTDEEQATLEIEALYRKKLKGKYHKNKDDVDKGSNIIQPMLAEKYPGWNDKNIRGQTLFSQPKLDGMRCLATKDGLFSREGSPILSSPHVHEALKNFFNVFPHVVLDGELYNHDLRNDFNKLMSLARKTKNITSADFLASKENLQYHVYDVIMTGNFMLRHEFLKSSWNLINYSYIKLVETSRIYTQEELDGLYAIYLSKEYEGQMVRLDGSYQQKRSKFLMKRKEWITEEFPVDDIVQGEGNWAGMAKSLRSHTEDGVEFSAQITGDQDYCRQLLIDKNDYHWVTVRYQGKTPDGSLRFATTRTFFKGKRDI